MKTVQDNGTSDLNSSSSLTRIEMPFEAGTGRAGLDKCQRRLQRGEKEEEVLKRNAKSNRVKQSKKLRRTSD